jgi:hypothetical protein
MKTAPIHRSGFRASRGEKCPVIPCFDESNSLFSVYQGINGQGFENKSLNRREKGRKIRITGNFSFLLFSRNSIRLRRAG